MRQNFMSHNSSLDQAKEHNPPSQEPLYKIHVLVFQEDTMNPSIRKNCPDCDGALHPIRLIDKGHGDAHRELEYTLVEAQRSRFLSRYPVEGYIEAHLCDRCGRVLLYARTQDENAW